MKFLNLATLFLGTILMVSCSKKTVDRLEVPLSNISNFDSQQKDLLMSGSSDDPMRLYLTTNKNDSLLLRKRSEEVTPNPNDPLLTACIDRLLTTVQDSLSLGVGIAAPQIGILKRIIWVQRFDKEGFPFEVYLNPTIKQYTEKKQNCMEGCLSIPNKQAETKVRAYAILIEYDTKEGEHKIEMVEDFTAVIFQHEIDHLDGVLFIDLLEDN